MSDSKYNEVEQLFIREILDQHGEYLADLLTESIDEKNLIIEGELIDSIRYKVSMRGNSPVLSFSFLSHGRFIEINYFKKKSENTKRRFDTNTNRDIWNIREKQSKKKNKDTRWYTRNVYGSQNRLIGMLGSEFTKQEIARLKNIIELQKQRAV